MEQTGFGISDSNQIKSFSREDLEKKYTIVTAEIGRLARENYELRNKQMTAGQIKLILEEQLGELRNSVYGSSSERYKKPERPNPPKEPKPRIKKPSERYPNIPVREQVVEVTPPQCGGCGKTMIPSGLSEESEQLTVIPKKYEILRVIRPKFQCHCRKCLVAAPLPPRIIPGSTYSDEMIQDVVISKYCDLIPIDRYVQMAKRGGLMDLPPQSLIELTHAYADFVAGVYSLIKAEILKARVLHADETPHKMLEGSLIKSWYLWGFSTPTECYLECRNTRSGDVASELLLKSMCEVLLTDVFSGYGKSVRETNIQRELENRVLVANANCNAHARRYFFKSRVEYPEANFYLDRYHEIYQLNEDSKGKSHAEILEIRSHMRAKFEAMQKQALQELSRYPTNNKFRRALSYFLGNYLGLTLFLEDPEVPIDNNPQERLLRSHVVGRKTWYGTHSERGAFTAAVLFTIMETCKLNGVNPREYLKNLTEDLLAGAPPYTPKDFKSKINS